MPETSLPEFAILASATVIAALLAWALRGARSNKEKQAVNARWQHQLDAQQSENDRLQSQNTSLMQQINQYQASNSDARNRTQELADTLREAMERRDELQRQLKDIRGNLESAMLQRDSLRSDVESRNARYQTAARALNEKDDRIAHLKRELSNWQSRVPPLVERYRNRDLEAREFELELEQARERIAALEGPRESDDTRIGAVDNAPGDLDASNDQYEETSLHDMSGFHDQPLTPAGFATDADGYASLDNHDRLPRDDLKRIKGVGPAIEKILNELGFYSFDQIADLSDRDLAHISERLRGFSSRIHREDWIGQARMLRFENNHHPT